MTGNPSADAQAKLEKILLRHHVAQAESAGREHIEGNREALARLDDELRVAIAAAEDAANGSLDTAAQDELRRLLERARVHLGENAPDEPDKPQIFLDHKDKPCDPLKYAREQLGDRDFEALGVRDEDTRRLYAFIRTNGRRIPIGESKDVRSMKIVTDRLWDHDIVPSFTRTTWTSVQRALLCLKRPEAGITAAEITRDWLADFAAAHLTTTPAKPFDLDDNDDRTTVSGYGDPSLQPVICWVTGWKFGASTRLLIHLAAFDKHVRVGLKQQIGRGQLPGRLGGGLRFTDERVQPPRSADPRGSRNGRRYWASPDGFTFEDTR
jgi:hypothetical protein